MNKLKEIQAAKLQKMVVVKGRTVRHDGKDYGQNAVISLSAQDAGRLQELGFVVTLESVRQALQDPDADEEEDSPGSDDGGEGSGGQDDDGAGGEGSGGQDDDGAGGEGSGGQSDDGAGGEGNGGQGDDGAGSKSTDGQKIVTTSAVAKKKPGRPKGGTK
ncbi:hypothetical protein [Serratia marcescens]|uniref:hypothetical protein n=1 Tax=Serratia marcescens TaxID=615 RepID=UPI001BAFAF29|nr:hypothetical protein [Serratia marcescens]MBS3894601.1 hypothetical protein [Serratia marcescens]